MKFGRDILSSVGVPLTGALLGAGLGGLSSKNRKKRIRNAVIGALLGAGSAKGVQYLLKSRPVSTAAPVAETSDAVEPPTKPVTGTPLHARSEASGKRRKPYKPAKYVDHRVSSRKPPGDLLEKYKEIGKSWKDGMTRKEWLATLTPEQRSIYNKYHNWAKRDAQRVQNANQLASDRAMEEAGIEQAKGDFWDNMAENGQLNNTLSRAGQIVTYGFTDLGAGVTDLVGAHGTADKIRNFQNILDESYNMNMTDRMREAYQDDKVGRAFGEIGSSAIGAALTAGVGSKVHLAGKASNILRATRIPEAKGVAWLLSKLSPTASHYLTAAGGAAANIRGTSPDTAVARYSGDVNPVMRLKDAINLRWMGDRASFGERRSMDRLEKTIKDYLSTYNPSGDKLSVRPITLKGKSIHGSDRFGKKLDNPLLAGSENEQIFWEKYLPVFRKYHESSVKGSGGFESSWLGKILGYRQARFRDVPAMIKNDSGGYDLIPRPDLRVDKDGNFVWPMDSIYMRGGHYLDRKLGTGGGWLRPFARLGGATEAAANIAKYQLAPYLTVGHDLYRGVESGDGASTGSALAYTAVSSIPYLRNLPGWKGTSSRLLSPVVGSYAGGAIHPGEALENDINARILANQLILRDEGGAIPGYFAGTK